jgi:gluconate 2-dehydrogenase subunit 3-like protein
MKPSVDQSSLGRRIPRREAIRWVIAAAAAGSVVEVGTVAFAAPEKTLATHGYGTDPKLNEVYKPGDLWPLTFNENQRRTAAALCDVIIPADDKSAAASELNVHDFIDEWISAPYPRQQSDRKSVLEGLAWLDAESIRRFKKGFAQLSNAQQCAICDDICDQSKAKHNFQKAAAFFANFRNLAASGFYTTPEGMKDLQYVGNVALTQFDGPPPEVLKHLNLQ